VENKEALVEQIAKAICPIIQPFQCRELCTNVGNCQELKDVCRKIVNGFSRHDTAVVLPKENYEEYQELLKNFDSYLFEYRKFADGYIEHSHKDTAEKLLNWLWKKRNAIGQLMIFEEHLKEKAKEFGVEIKE
jgi:hypothetical protein